MKKVLTLGLVLVLICAFAVGLAAKAVPHPPTHECWIESECTDEYCVYYKCCKDCVWDKGGYVCITTCLGL